MTTQIIAPGPIAGTEGVARLLPKDMVEEISKSIPIQRYGTVEDIANAGIFLFSPAASYITGAALVVDGGEWHNSNQVSLSTAVVSHSTVLMPYCPPSLVWSLTPRSSSREATSVPFWRPSSDHCVL